MFDAGSAVGKMGLDISGFTGGILQAQALSSLFPQTVTSFLANPLLGFANLAKEAMQTAVGAIKGMISVVQEAAGAADSLGDLAANVGVSASELSEMGMVAERAGADLRTVADAYKFLGRNIQEALNNPGGKQADAFRAIGISLTDAAGKVRPLADLMREVGDGIAGAGDASLRTDVAMKLLGDSGNKLVSMFSQTSTEIDRQRRELRGWNASVTDAAASSADAFKDLQVDLTHAWTGIKNMFAQPIIERLTPVLADLRNWIDANQPYIRQKIGELVDGVVAGVEIIINSIQRLKAILAGAGIGALLGGIAGFNVAGPLGAIAGAGIGAAAGGAAGYVVGGMSQPAYNNITIRPRSDSSTSEISDAIQQAMREAERNWQQQRAVDLERAAIQGGF